MKIDDEEDLAKIAGRLSAENELAAARIVELEGEIARFEAERRGEPHAAVVAALALIALLSLFAFGWRMGADGEYDAGFAAGKSAQCGEDVE